MLWCDAPFKTQLRLLYTFMVVLKSCHGCPDTVVLFTGRFNGLLTSLWIFK